jgi:hypothetical protein
MFGWFAALSVKTSYKSCLTSLFTSVVVVVLFSEVRLLSLLFLFYFSESFLFSSLPLFVWLLRNHSEPKNKNKKRLEI